METRSGSPDRLDLTDAILEQLKEQSPEGCLLCALEAWDAEEWD